MGWVVSVTPLPRFTPGERTPGTHWTGGWVGPRAGLDTEARGHILFLCRKWKPGRPLCSQTLYRLSYPSSYTQLFVLKDVSQTSPLCPPTGYSGEYKDVSQCCGMLLEADQSQTSLQRSFALKMEAVTTLDSCQTARSNIAQDSHLRNTYSCDVHTWHTLSCHQGLG
jgi:hypothetical protein